MENNIVVVIPIYKNKINLLEEISLRQIYRILGAYDKCFVAPKSLNFNYGRLYSDFNIERFDDRYFKNTRTYSELLLSIDFYKRFRNYKYMLLHQLDAIVFFDSLKAFCNLNYDYIGAPWPRTSSMYKYARNSVGNGGLSLRNIESTIHLLKIAASYINNNVIPNLACVGEDAVFSLFGNKFRGSFKVAPINVAIQFSLERDVCKRYKQISAKMPFGCHKWYGLNFRTWCPIIESYGYEIDTKDSNIIWVSDIERRKSIVYEYIIKKNLYTTSNIVLKNIGNYVRKLFLRKKCSLWGGGRIGKRCIDILHLLDIKIERVYDVSLAGNREIFEGVMVCLPNNEMLKKEEFIIITSINYSIPMEKTLKELGLEEGNQFLKYLDVECSILKFYYEYKNGSVVK